MGKNARWQKPFRATAVRCPHCGRPYNLLEFDYVLQGGDLNPIFECEEQDDAGNELGCGGKFQVVKVEDVKLIWVRPTDQEGSIPGDTRGQ